MRIQFLEASVPLTKAYAKAPDGTITKTPYPFVWEFTSHEVSIKNLAELEVVMTNQSALNRCMLKGSIARPLVKESRAGATDSNAPTEFVVLDLDGLPEEVLATNAETGVEGKLKVTIDALLGALGLADVSYIIQWSAGYGIENTKLRAHIVFLLDKPVAAPLLKQWLIQLNHSTPMLTAAMDLTKTGNSISWPLDVSACQNDKLIYIAPPVLKGIKDPMNGRPRISMVTKKQARLSIGGHINSTAKNRELTNKRLEALREIHGLPKRKTSYRMQGSIEVMVKPDSCTITEMRTERGFVYFNLNGGDSWAYYHPENNPEYIFNFKGESAYLTKELLPDYYEQLTSTGVAKANSHGISYLAFCDRATGAYWRGSYDAAADELDIYVAKNETQVRHFAKQHGLPLGDFIPEWDVVFDPHDAVRVDFGNRTVNTFTLSPFMKAVARTVTTCPKTIHKVIHHALGSDEPTTLRFINWVAYILQQRDRTKTAWVFHGVPGTGKGLLCTILRKIFGQSQTTARRMEELNEPYNPWMKSTFLVFVDEVQTKALQNERGVMAKLKNFITEEYVPVREMYSSAYEARNRTNWIFNSNMPDPILIEKGDRRFNVGKYQPTKITMSDKEMVAIDRELQSFHDYLLCYPVDTTMATSVMESADRATLMAIGETSIDTVATALLEGNFGFFIDQLPTDDNYITSPIELQRVSEYETVLKAILARTDRNNGGCSMGREELRALFQYCVGGMPTTPNKFTSLLKHHRVHIHAVWVPPKTVNGVKTTWQDVAKWPTYLGVFNTVVTPIGKAKKLVKVH